MTADIIRLFKESELTETSNGSFKTICPSCLLQGGRTEGLILNIDTGIAYCHSSHKHFNLLEIAGLKLGLIRCLDGKDSGDRESIYDDNDDLLTETLERVEEEYGAEMKEIIINTCYVKKNIGLPFEDKLISEFAKQVSRVLQDKNILFFRPDSKEIVEIRKIKADRQNANIKGNSFTTITSNRFITLIERYINPGIYSKNKKTDALEFHKKSIYSSLSAVLIESHILQDSLPKIRRIFTVPMPIMYDGKLTFPKKGYDERFESWLPFTAPEITNPNMNLIEAKKIIDDMFSEFCFKEEDDRVNTIAALLTPFLKGLFKAFNTRTPVPFYIANRERAGKDYLAGITGIVYEGAALEEPPISNNDNAKTNSNEELRKKILSAMIAGRKRLHFSNNKGFINNAVLEQVITSAQYSDRILGKNETLIFDNELDISLSGNNATYTADFANRARIINLFLEIEDANSRKFKNPDLHGWVRDNRNEILSALFSFINNWIVMGTPKGSLPFASFQEWASVCGGIMESAGYGNPCKLNSNPLIVSGDMETRDMKDLFIACYNLHPDKFISRAEIEDIIKREGFFPYTNFDDKSHQTKFGIKLSKFIGRILSDIKMEVDNPNVRGSRQHYIFAKLTSELKKTDMKKEENLASTATLALLIPSPVSSEKDSIYIQQCQNNAISSQSCQKILENTPKPQGLCEKQQILPKKPEKYELPTHLSKDVEVRQKEPVPKPKTDREIQFWDPICVDTKDIKPNHTKEDVLEWIKNNPDGFTNFKILYDKFGVGSLRFKNELLKDKEIIEKNGRYYVKRI